MPPPSRRIPADLGPNRLAEARARLGRVAFDLTVSNPTLCGLPYPTGLLDGLADPRGLDYLPDPRGPEVARTAVASAYRELGAAVDPGRVVLTASTSEAYSFLFKLVADPGDTVLVPSPSYPLFEHLARLDGLELSSYALDPDAAWRLDLSELEAAPARTRAVIVVHPNNPTGSYVHPDDARTLTALCRERGWALIADEVFLPYPLDGGPGSDASFAAADGCLCFALGGLSKSAGLPQLKLAWIVVAGGEEEARPALEALEYVADAYLSVSTPTALAAPGIMARAAAVRAAIADRCRSNLEALRGLAAAVPAVSVLPVGGGWNAVLRVPALTDDESLCLHLLESEAVAVLPGAWFEFPRRGFLVLSLLAEESLFAEGCRRLLRAVAAGLEEG